jgi:hypothetical protein
MAVTTSIANWDFNNFHVQVDIQAGEFIDAATVLIAAGPPKLRLAGNNIQAEGLQNRALLNAVAYPIGVVENFALSQNRQLQRLFEIGSKRSYFIVGRNVGALQIARTLFHGPSLLRALYAYYPATKIGRGAVQLLASGAGRATGVAPALRSNPGFADFFANLDSDLFDQPFGLFMILKDSKNQSYAGIYLEDVFLQAHQFSVNSSSTLVAEGVSAQFDQVIPVDVGAVPRTTVSETQFENRVA